MTFADTHGYESPCRQRRERNNARRQSQRLADGHSADASVTVVEPSGLVIELAYRYSRLELLMGQLDDITDAQLQSWIAVTESAMEAEMKYVKFLAEEKGLPKEFAGRVGAMAKHIEAIEALREMLSELNAEVSKRAGQL
jgi:hypothetical protein